MDTHYGCLLSHIFYSENHTPYKYILSFAPHWSLSTRKSLIKLCRACIIPEEGTQLYNMVIDTFQAPYRTMGLKTVPLQSLYDTDFSLLYYSDLHILDSLFTSNIISPILIQIIRSAPCTNETEIREAYTSAVNSEMEAHKFDLQPKTYDFYGLFTGSCSPITSDFPYDASMYAQIRKKINDWMVWISRGNKVFYPKMSKKLSSRDLLERSFYGHYASISDPFSFEAVTAVNNREVPFTLIERMRMKYKGRVPLTGREEMRRKWSFKDNKPRPYYAMGATSFERTTLSRQIILNLCDTFPGTHRTNKLEVDDLVFRTGDSIFLYDYTAFTSSFYVVQCFLRDLEQYAKEFLCPVTGEIIQLAVVSGGELRHVFLHELIHDLYLAHHEVHFRWETHPGCVIDMIAYKSGLLGVFSNIVISTFVHGLFLNILTGGFFRNKCAGDDALIVGKNFQFPAWIQSLSTLASFELSKTFQAIKQDFVGDPDDEDGEIREGYERMVYLKRPLDFDGCLVYKWDLMPLYSFSDFYIPKHYTDLPSKPEDRMGSIMLGIRRLLFYIHDHVDVEDLTHLELSMIRIILTIPYESTLTSKFRLPCVSPRGGVLPNGSWMLNIEPYLNTNEAFKINPFQVFLDQRPLTVNLPVHRLQIISFNQPLTVGSRFQSNITPPLSYASKIGLLSKSKVITEYTSTGSLLDTQYLITSIMHNKKELVFEFIVLEELPKDLEDLIRDRRDVTYRGPDTNMRFYNDDI